MLGARAVGLLTAMTVTLFAASCSGDEIKLDDYRRQVGALFTRYDQDVNELTSQLQTQGTKDEVFASLAAYADAGIARTNEFLAAWDALKVPERARNVHDQGRALIASYAAAFDTLRTGAEAQDEGAREAFNDALQDHIPVELTQFQDALNGLS